MPPRTITSSNSTAAIVVTWSLPVALQGAETPPSQIQRLYATAAHDDQTGEIILKIVNPGADATTVNINLAGISKIASDAKSTVLAGSDLSDVNSFGNPAPNRSGRIHHSSNQSAIPPNVGAALLHRPAGKG